MEVSRGRIRGIRWGEDEGADGERRWQLSWQRTDLRYKTPPPAPETLVSHRSHREELHFRISQAEGPPQVHSLLAQTSSLPLLKPSHPKPRSLAVPSSCPSKSHVPSPREMYSSAQAATATITDWMADANLFLPVLEVQDQVSAGFVSSEASLLGL